MEELWQFQCRWSSAWGAATALWGMGVAGWALWRWHAPTPLPLVGGLLLGMLLLTPLIRLALGTLAAREPAGPRGRAWLAWYLAGAVARPPVSVLLAMVELLAQVGTPAFLVLALAQLHPALAIFAVVPSLWRERIARALTVQGE